MANDDAEPSATEEHLTQAELDMLWENSKRQRKQRVQLAFLAVLTSIVLMSFITIKLFDQKNQLVGDASGLISDLLRSQEVSRTLEFKNAQSVLFESFNKAVEKASTKSNLDAGTAVLISDMEQLKSRLNLIENSISENPQRALSLPLLRRDQDELSRKLDEFRISTKADTDRLWGQMNTILQFIFAIFLAVATGAVTVLYGAYKQRENGKS